MYVLDFDATVDELTAFAARETGRNDLLVVPSERGNQFRYEHRSCSADAVDRLVVRVIDTDGHQYDAVLTVVWLLRPAKDEPVSRRLTLERVPQPVHVPANWTGYAGGTRARRRWLTRLLGR